MRGPAPSSSPRNNGAAIAQRGCGAAHIPAARPPLFMEIAENE